MYFQKIIPTKPLQCYIRYFWILEDVGNTKFKIIPDGLPGIVLQEVHNTFLDNEGQMLPQMFLYGQTTFHSELRASGNFRNIGVYLETTALKTIFGIDAFQLTNQYVSIDCITHHAILEQLLNAASVDDKIEIISQLFIKLIQQPKHDTKNAAFATKLLQKGMTLKEVQSEMNLSERSLERMIKQYVGISPKLFSRIVRFQMSLQALRQRNFYSLTQLAYKNNYFDQAHYIRDFKEFTGLTPTQFIQQTNEHLENFPEWKF